MNKHERRAYDAGVRARELSDGTVPADILNPFKKSRHPMVRTTHDPAFLKTDLAQAWDNGFASLEQ